MRRPLHSHIAAMLHEEILPSALTTLALSATFTYDLVFNRWGESPGLGWRTPGAS